MDVLTFSSAGKSKGIKDQQNKNKNKNKNKNEINHAPLVDTVKRKENLIQQTISNFKKLNSHVPNSKFATNDGARMQLMPLICDEWRPRLNQPAWDSSNYKNEIAAKIKQISLLSSTAIENCHFHADDLRHRRWQQLGVW